MLTAGLPLGPTTFTVPYQIPVFHGKWMNNKWCMHMGQLQAPSSDRGINNIPNYTLKEKCLVSTWSDIAPVNNHYTAFLHLETVSCSTNGVVSPGSTDWEWESLHCAPYMWAVAVSMATTGSEAHPLSTCPLLQLEWIGHHHMSAARGPTQHTGKCSLWWQQQGIPSLLQNPMAQYCIHHWVEP